jgi:hypothetical protein
VDKKHNSMTSLALYISHSAMLTVMLCATAHAVCGQCTLRGRVVNGGRNSPVGYATITLLDRGVWAATNERGEFKIGNVARGKLSVEVACLGYVKGVFSLAVEGDVDSIVWRIEEDNLALKEVVVTAKSKTDAATTTYVIDRRSLEHIQLNGVADITALLPGGQTNLALHLASESEQRIALRSADSEDGNASFATALEVDGVRLNGNASFVKEKRPTASKFVVGVDTRSIASGNVESVEVITGVPSVEYGDMGNGIVKINTKKGKAPLEIALATKPNTKQLAVNKGWALPSNAGVVNLSLERTKSVADLASPYTSYDRNAMSLAYENSFGQRAPLRLTAGISGNIGGYDNRNDPDRFGNDYVTENDHYLRAHTKLSWMPSKPYITSVELLGTVSYADNLYSKNTNKNSSASVAAVHSTDEGYFVASSYDSKPNAAVVLIPAGYWYELYHVDNRPLNLAATAKARWTHRLLGGISSSAMLGADVSSTGNIGRGLYYAQPQFAANGWREYRYDQLPFMHSVSPYVEEKIVVPISSSSSPSSSSFLSRQQLMLVAGLRSDITVVEASQYGTVGSFSPRFNAKYSATQLSETLHLFSLRAGWGKAVKLPSFEVLYPRPTYSDILAFAPGTLPDGTSYSAYYTQPYSARHNPNLSWQNSLQTELGAELKLGKIYLSLAYYHSRTRNAYKARSDYEPYAFKFTGQASLEGNLVPPANRIYSIDQHTGVVTVADKTGAFAPRELAYTSYNALRTIGSYDNASPAVRQGLEWVLKTDKLPALQTSAQLDGSFYHYRSVETALLPFSPTSQRTADGSFYRYIGYYIGDNSNANGSQTRKLTANLTLTTHIPAVRLVVSLRVETTLYHQSQRLSESGNASLTRSFVLDDRTDFFPSGSGENIYNSNRYAALYPVYYATADKPTPVPFAESFAWAKTNDTKLFNELASLVMKSNTDYYFNANSRSAYGSANISVTKEIGRVASISFNATNFTNTMQKVRQGDQNVEYSAYEIAADNAGIPRFYYGMSLRILINN